MLKATLEKKERELKAKLDPYGSVYTFAVDSVNGQTGHVVLTASDLNTYTKEEIEQRYGTNELAILLYPKESEQDKVKENNIEIFGKILNNRTNVAKLYCSEDDTGFIICAKLERTQGKITANFVSNYDFLKLLSFTYIIDTEEIIYSASSNVVSEIKDSNTNKIPTVGAVQRYVMKMITGEEALSLDYGEV